MSAGNKTRTLTREWKVGILGCALLVGGMLAYALFGEPGYSFYAPLKGAVVVAAGAGAWALYVMSKRYLPVSLALGMVGAVHLFGKMHRDEWLQFDWMALVLMLLLAVLMSWDLLRRGGASRDESGGAE